MTTELFMNKDVSKTDETLQMAFNLFKNSVVLSKFKKKSLFIRNFVKINSC
jgi:hypothetical protein